MDTILDCLSVLRFKTSVFITTLLDYIFHIFHKAEFNITGYFHQLIMFRIQKTE